MSNFPGKIVEFPPVTPFCFVGKNVFFEFSEKNVKCFFNEFSSKKFRIFFNSLKLTIKNFRNFFQ